MSRSLREELEKLLQELCIVQGFCSMPESERLSLVTSLRLTADEFAIALLRGEGFLDPHAEVHWMRTLSNLFVNRFGSMAISAEESDAGKLVEPQRDFEGKLVQFSLALRK